MNSNITTPEGWMDDAAWLAARKQCLTATDAAAILGKSPFAGPMDIWARKLGLAAGPNMNERMRWGLRLEEPVAQAFAEETGRSVCLPPQRLMLHPQKPWMGASLDRIQEDPEKGRGVLEIKTTSQSIGDELPDHWLVQVAHQMLVAQLDWASVATLVGGNRLIHVDLECSDRLSQVLVEKLEEFWGYVQSQTPPPTAEDDVESAAMRAMYLRDNGVTVQLPPESADWAQNYVEASTKIGYWMKVKDDAKQQLIAAMGEASIGVAADGTKFSHKVQKKKGYSIAPCEKRVFRRVSSRCM